VIGNISAWNYPYFVGSNVFFPALLTGNAVLYKPSEFATDTGEHIARILHASGVPKEIFALLPGDGKVGAELAQLPLDGIFFTGSYATGVKVAQSAAASLMRVQLELGGKDPAYICEDVDLEATAASVADGAFYNNGQSCCSVERIYVHDRIFKPFVEAFVREVAKFKVGDPMDEKTYLGPLTRGAHVAYLETQVADAVSKGARILCGGKKLDGNYFQPTVLIDVTLDMLLMREETFGPVIGLQKIVNDEKAIELMNDTPYGLTAAVFTKDQARAKRILARINAGSAYWNCSDRVSPRLPWSGRGHSGVGCTLSTYGIQAFLKPKAWHLFAK
jgi:acyl-CoA reductase-like NAD-dependent aldehyde dehydrogenase